MATKTLANKPTQPKYRSKFEKEIGEDLSRRKISFTYEGKPIIFRRHIRNGLCSTCFSSDVHRAARYYPDFTVRHSDGKAIYIETKGWFTSQDRTKTIDLLDQGYDIRLVFMRDNLISKTSKTRYSTWCKALDVPYSFGKVPSAWLKGVVKSK